MSSPQPPDVYASSRLCNFRDLGGLALVDGRRTRSGTLYRSEAPHPHDRMPPVGAPVWPPSIVVDLRSPGEPGSVFTWAEPTRSVTIPLMAQAAPDVVQGPLPTLYLHMLAQAPRELTTIVSIVARAEGPVLVHCAAGKDRTGVATAILLLAAGVTIDAVVADYAATENNLDRLLVRLRDLGEHRLPPPAQVRRAPPEAILAVLNFFDGQPHGIAGWLTTHGLSLDDLAAWRRRFAS